jgi:hypothetical protein
MQGDPDTALFTRSGAQVAKGFIRVIVDDQGAHLELDAKHLIEGSLRHSGAVHHRYIELLTVDDVKVRLQVQTVDRSDYVPGMFYVSPFDLQLADGTGLVDPLNVAA